MSKDKVKTTNQTEDSVTELLYKVPFVFLTITCFAAFVIMTTFLYR